MLCVISTLLHRPMEQRSSSAPASRSASCSGVRKDLRYEEATWRKRADRDPGKRSTSPVHVGRARGRGRTRRRRARRSPDGERRAGVPARVPDPPSIESHIAALEPDLLLSAAYARIVPEEVLAIRRSERSTSIPSLLPDYRGYLPSGGLSTKGALAVGVTIHEMTFRSTRADPRPGRA